MYLIIPTKMHRYTLSMNLGERRGYQAIVLIEQDAGYGLSANAQYKASWPEAARGKKNCSDPRRH
jgi:hypothetical protein